MADAAESKQVEQIADAVIGNEHGKYNNICTSLNFFGTDLPC